MMNVICEKDGFQNCGVRENMMRKVTLLAGRVAVNVSLMLVSLNAVMPHCLIHCQSKFSKHPILTYWLNFLKKRAHFNFVK